MKRILAYGPGLSAELRSFIAAKKLTLDQSSLWGVDFLERLEPFATGGKLLRGSVLCFAYEIFSGQAPNTAVINAAMALELTHSALLIHDDIMDDDDLRRGRPSMHRQYQSAAENDDLADPSQFGISMALSGGDAALFMALELFGKSQAHTQAGRQSYSLFVEQLLKTCVGQMQDVYLEAAMGAPSKRAIYDLMRAKTASYTLALPLAMGAAMAGEPDPVIKRLEAVGAAGGTIFQLRDDELGVLGDTAKTGKPVGADIKEGKKTLIHYYLVKNCSAAERRKINAIFGNVQAAEQDIAYIQALVRRLRIPQLLSDAVKILRAKAYSDISKLALPNDAKDELRQLIDFCAKRQA